MSGERYEIRFNGVVVEGFDFDQVKIRVARLFNLSADRLEQLFSRPEVILKRDLSAEEAERFRELLRKLGLETFVREMASPGAAATPEPSDPPSEQPVETRAEAVDGPEVEPVPFLFHGTGWEYFRIWVVNILLTILTLGIYSAWAKVRTNRYFYANTEMAGSRFEYLASPLTILKGRIIAGVFIAGYYALQNFRPDLAPFAMLALLLLMPWMVTRSLIFRARNSAFRFVRFDFLGRTGEAFLALFLFPLLGILSFGLLLPYAAYRQARFLVANSAYGQSRFAFETGPGAYYRAAGVLLLMILVAAGLVFLASTTVPQLALVVPLFGLVFYLVVFAYVQVVTLNLRYNGMVLADHGLQANYQLGSFLMLLITNGLGMLLTLGLFYPWAKIRLAHYAAEHVEFLAVGDINDFVAGEQSSVSAVGQEMGDLMDFEFGL